MAGEKRIRCPRSAVEGHLSRTPGIGSPSTDDPLTPCGFVGTNVTLGDVVAITGQSLLAATVRILLAANTN